VGISRPNFVELCLALTATDERAFEELWRRLGLVGRLVADVHDDRRARPADLPALVSRLLERGEAYQVEAPTLWDVDFQTAVAQAELEDASGRGDDPDQVWTCR